MEKIHIMENEELQVEISDLGGELSRIYDKKNNREVLWNANTAWWPRHAPILFPFVGSCYQGEYRYNGKSYPMAGHGFARDTEAVCEKEEKNQVIHRIEDSELTRKTYPFSFCLRITHTLKERSILVSYEVMNMGKEDMYFSIGGHPAFMLPKGIEQKDCGLLFGNKNSLTYLLIDENSRGASIANPQSLETEDGYLVIGENRFDKDALIFENTQIEEISLTLPDKKPYVTVYSKGFPYFGIWSKPKAPFVCLEPWYGRCDDHEFKGELKDKTGVNQLAPKESFQAQYEIKIQ